MALACALPCLAGPQDAVVEFGEDRKGFALGLGAAYVRFDTNAKFTDGDSGESIFIDAEGTLGLPEAAPVPAIYGAYRFSPKHAFGFSYFQVRRKTTLLEFDFNLGDLNLSGEATLEDRTRFFELTYRYTFFEDNRSGVAGAFGLYGLDMNYSFAASGEITLDGVTRSGEIDEKAGLFAPLPMFGLDLWFAFTPKWSMSGLVSVVGGRYQNVTAGIVNATVRSRYQFTKHWGFLMGLTWFDAEVKIDDLDDRTDVSYGYNGVFLGFHVIF